MNKREMEKRIKEMERQHQAFTRSTSRYRDLRAVEVDRLRDRIVGLEKLKRAAERLWGHLHSDPQPPKPPWE